MPKFKLEVELPTGVDMVRLAFTKDGWEAACMSYATVDRHGVKIDSQLGWSFKERTPEKAVLNAALAAREHTIRIKRTRDAKAGPNEPKLSEADELSKLLGI